MSTGFEKFADTIEKMDSHKKFYEQFGKFLKRAIHEDSTDQTGITELVRFSNSKSGAFVTFSLSLSLSLSFAMLRPKMRRTAKPARISTLSTTKRSKQLENPLEKLLVRRMNMGHRYKFVADGAEKTLRRHFRRLN